MILLFQFLVRWRWCLLSGGISGSHSTEGQELGVKVSAFVQEGLSMPIWRRHGDVRKVVCWVSLECGVEIEIAVTNTQAPTTSLSKKSSKSVKATSEPFPISTFPLSFPFLLSSSIPKITADQIWCLSFVHLFLHIDCVARNNEQSMGPVHCPAYLSTFSYLPFLKQPSNQ